MGLLDAVLGAFSENGSYDNDCDWFCDNCDVYMNDQPGFRAGGTWVCSECGELNDVSPSNEFDPWNHD